MYQHLWLLNHEGRQRGAKLLALKAKSVARPLWWWNTFSSRGINWAKCPAGDWTPQTFPCPLPALRSFPISQSDSLETHKYFFTIFMITNFQNCKRKSNTLHKLSTPLGKELLLLFLPRNSVRAEVTPQDIKLFSLVLNTRINKIPTFPTRFVSSPSEGKGGDFLIEKWGDFF